MVLPYLSRPVCVCESCCSVPQSCSILCNPIDCSTPGFPVHHYLPELAQTHVHRVGDAIQLSCPVIPFSSCLQSFPASGAFLISRLFASGGQSIGASASASILLMKIQGWFPLGLTEFKEFSRVFSSTIQSINTSVLSILYGPTCPSIPDYWKKHRSDSMDLCQQSDAS